MTVRIRSENDQEAAIVVQKEDLYVLLVALAQAKFGEEIRTDVLLAPFVNALMRAVIDYSDEQFILASGSRWKILIPDAEVEGSLAQTIVELLRTTHGEAAVREYLAEALFPYRLETKPAR